jgi:hypothetical protein
VPSLGKITSSGDKKVTYDKKFEGLLAAIAEAKSQDAECLVVASPGRWATTMTRSSRA